MALFDGGYVRTYSSGSQTSEKENKQKLRAELKEKWKRLFQEDEELFNEIIVELRQEKINKIINK